MAQSARAAGGAALGGALLRVAARMTDGSLERVSVIVPVGPGDAPAPELTAGLATLPAAAELIAVCADGHAVACAPRWQRLTAPRGRARQQNAGAAAATRPWLWFVHADSRLAPRTLPALAAFVAGAPALGYFDLRFFDGPALLGLNAMGAWFRSRVLGLPFGDQGFVLPRAVFDDLGGFDPAIARGEDHDLVWRARRHGVPLRPVGAPLYTSGRRYAQHGWLATTIGTMRESWRQARRFSRAAEGR
jgi:hypothetical protein